MVIIRSTGLGLAHANSVTCSAQAHTSRMAATGLGQQRDGGLGCAATSTSPDASQRVTDGRDSESAPECPITKTRAYQIGPPSAT
jgi:hypothetical protein